MIEELCNLETEEIENHVIYYELWDHDKLVKQQKVLRIIRLNPPPVAKKGTIGQTCLPDTPKEEPASPSLPVNHLRSSVDGPEIPVSDSPKEELPKEVKRKGRRPQKSEASSKRSSGRKERHSKKFETPVVVKEERRKRHQRKKPEVVTSQPEVVSSKQNDSTVEHLNDLK